MRFTISILTFNRKDILAELLESLRNVSSPENEIIVIDNGSTDGTSLLVKERFGFVKLITLPRNTGVAGRNSGIVNAGGNIIITLDDDVLDIDSRSLETLYKKFADSPKLGAVCFTVRDYYDGKICNWCHPYPEEEYFDKEFITDEISEGAVAFRKKVFDDAGLYPDNFFISHEGADLAARIMDRGYDIAFTPEIAVRHKYARSGRKSWRRYYYDTRNSYWLAVRNYRTGKAIRYIMARSAIMLAYSLRDGFFTYWLKAVSDSITALPEMLRQRHPISKETQLKMKLIDSNRPGFLYFLKKRLFASQVRI